MDDVEELIKKFAKEYGADVIELDMSGKGNNRTVRVKGDQEVLGRLDKAVFDSIPLEKRREFIDSMIQGQIAGNARINVNYTLKEKIENGYYYNKFTLSDLKDFISSDEISQEEKLKVIRNFGRMERSVLALQLLELERRKEEKKGKDFNRNHYNSTIVKGLTLLLEPYDIVEFYSSEKINDEDFKKLVSRTGVKKEHFLRLKLKNLSYILSDKNNTVLNELGLKINSKDLINLYGRRLNGANIQVFAGLGYIDLKDVIDVYEINKVLDPENFDSLSNEELKKFYNPKLLLKMKNNDGITPYFIEKNLELQDFSNDEKYFREKSTELSEGLKALSSEEGKEGEFEENLLYFFDIGFCDLETVKENVSNEYLEKLANSKKLELEKIFDYYLKGLIGKDLILNNYSEKQILEAYSEKKIGRESLKLISDPNRLLDYFSEGKIEEADFINLYLRSDNLSLKDIEDGFEVIGKDDSEVFESFIDEDVSYEKIKELAVNYKIGLSTLIDLKNQRIISSDQYNEIYDMLSCKELIDDLRDNKTYTLVTNNTGNTGPRRKHNRTLLKEEMMKDKYSGEVDLISYLLDKDVEKEPHSKIASFNSKGLTTTLNDYRIFENGEAVILQKSDDSNAVYVMNIRQFHYFISTAVASRDGQTVLKGLMADKSYLRKLSGVFVVEHYENFSEKLVQATRSVSPIIDEKFQSEDEKYQKDVDYLVKLIRDEYLISRNKLPSGGNVAPNSQSLPDDNVPEI